MRPVRKKCQEGLMQDINHPARDVEVVWFGPSLTDSNDEDQGPAYGNVAFNMPARCLELLITEKGFNCYWMENFVWPQNIAVRFLLTQKVLALKEYFPLTSMDGPWLIRKVHAFGAGGTGAHFVQRRYIEDSMWRRVDLEFMIEENMDSIFSDLRITARFPSTACKERTLVQSSSKKRNILLGESCWGSLWLCRWRPVSGV